jgi:hypothetical protein
MTFFDIISHLFYKRPIKEASLEEADIQQFTPYMISRWLSFYDKRQCILSNETLNRFHSIDENKSSLYKLYYELIPKLSYKKIQYIKKTKESKDENSLEANIIMLAKNHNISSREVKMYMDLL